MSCNNSALIIFPFSDHFFSHNMLHEKLNNNFFPQPNQVGIKSILTIMHNNIEHSHV